MTTKIFFLIFTIAISIFTEKKLIPLAQYPGMAIAIRCGYISWILTALSEFHPVLKWLHTAYVLLMLSCFLCLWQHIRIADEMREEQRLRFEELKRQKIMQWENEKIARLRSPNCPAGFFCEQMGAGDDHCSNRDKCERLMIPPKELRGW